MKEDKITKRIKELQSDTRFTFKLTEDIIDSIYRIAVEDWSNEFKEKLDKVYKKDPDKEYKKEDIKIEVDKIVSSGKEMNKRFGTKGATIDYEKLQQHIFKAKQEAYRDVLNYINKKNDLMDVYVYVKEMAKKTQYDEIKII